MGKVIVAFSKLLQSFYTYLLIGTFVLGLITGYIISTYL